MNALLWLSEQFPTEPTYWLFLILDAVILDFLIGDPAWIPHPVVLIGKEISFLEKRLNRGEYRKAKGFLMWGLIMLTVLILITLIEGLALLAGTIVFTLVTLLLMSLTLALKSLRSSVLDCEKALQSGNLDQARTYAGYLVGRETGSLDAPEITRAMIETSAENTVDGVFSPLCCMFLGILTVRLSPLLNPLTLAMLYKAVNTMDSMVGYINEPYRLFGYASAKIDDLANWIPARITPFFLILAGGILGFDAGGGRRIFFRDRLNHKSPNSAHAEATLAGLLGVRLGGNNVYFGEVLEKPTIGDARVPLEAGQIRDTLNIGTLAEVLFVLTMGLITLLLALLLH